jgi:hypothetical protein
MPDEVITRPDQVSAERLTAVLARSGALTSGTVTGFDVDDRHGTWSANAGLTLRYADGSQGTRPRRLFLKTVNTDLGEESFGPSEVDYYARDYVGVADAPLVRCYDAAYSAAARRYHLLLDDLSETHVEARHKTPTLAYGLALAEGLAALHAHWWGAARLAEAGAPIHGAAHIQRFVDIAEPGVAHIVKRFAAELAPHGPDALAALYARHPQRLIERTADANGFTLIHGDVGWTNILVPRDGDRPIYIIDRQPFDWSLTTWLGVYDLAYAVVLDWDVAVRRRLERQTLWRYHEQLVARGVRGYTWEQLLHDYRLAVPMGVYIATEYCRGGVNERSTHVWLPMLQRALTACDDLACHELW